MPRQSIVANGPAVLMAALILMLAPSGQSERALAHGSDGETVAPETQFLRKRSVHDVAVTIDRLAAAIEGAGATVFARIDHAAGAARTGQTLPASQVLVFGNPRLGTPLMKAAPEIAFDLPMRAWAHEDADGQVWLVTLKPEVLRRRYGVEGQDAVFARMGKALDRLTDVAVATE